ncbi:efflux RND transporter periplasmic adaptor subunit [Thalassotalea profundi]|uniref:MexE family multidrug efflux RND transporter periplasmic adaptor subunit n=1 Tax=Thalassotalea profundi TaxID=2036687 RepID=A0ABQ3IJF2_9GAMM|nr:efflux RND transporter periplasmic adaptor subunit [Thalassotalea profundi]GHE82778.1 MexE family multidrug efflux RND transporter periplasmic adaptor subunit [Thalassotalea profundi]
MKLKISTLMLSSALAISLSACGPSNAEKQVPAQIMAQQVDVITLKEQNVSLIDVLPARAVASKIAEVRPQVTGIILERHFTEGAFVEAGQTLYQVDDVIYKANLASAEAKVAQTNANLVTAKAELTRYEKLIANNAISQQNLDQARAQYKALQAELLMNKAALHKAQVDLTYTKVLAPISGQISKSNITEGALVSAGQSNALTTITQLDPIYFDIKQASAEINKLQQRLASGELQAVENSAQLTLGNKTIQGKLLFNEVQVNPSTDTVTMRAEFKNVDKNLMPGMFARIELIQAQRLNSILVPQKAVSFNRKGDSSVYVLTADNTVETKVISLGRSIGQDWLILSGLNVGDQVITSGLQKIRPGMTVSPVQSNIEAK